MPPVNNAAWDPSQLASYQPALSPNQSDVRYPSSHLVTKAYSNLYLSAPYTSTLRPPVLSTSPTLTAVYNTASAPRLMIPAASPLQAASLKTADTKGKNSNRTSSDNATAILLESSASKPAASVKKMTPIWGMGISAAWGMGNILEHLLHDGKLISSPKAKGLQKLARPLMPALRLWGAATPAINVIYGPINALAAFISPYGFRTLAFSSYSIASAALLPFGLKDNSRHLQMAQLKEKLLQQEGKLSPETATALNKKLAQVVSQSKPLHQWMKAWNSIVPIGLMLGLFTLTKATQSTPGVHLNHTAGNTWDTILHGDKDNPPLWKGLLSNFTKEAGVASGYLLRAPHYTMESLKAVGKAFHDLLNPSKEQRKQNAWQRFSSPLMDGPTVAFTYALTGFGRILAALSGVGLLALGQKAMVSEGLASSAGKVGVLPKLLVKTMGSMFLFGQLAGGISALFTRFGDWDPRLSGFYRISALPYTLSGIAALTASMGKAWKPLGLGASDLAKAGAFIQASSYFWNLTLQKTADTEKKASEKK